MFALYSAYPVSVEQSRTELFRHSEEGAVVFDPKHVTDTLVKKKKLNMSSYTTHTSGIGDAEAFHIWAHSHRFKMSFENPTMCI